MTELTDREQRFVSEYLVDLNATQAAIRAGYSEKTARQQASRLLTKDDVVAAIAERKVVQLAKADLTAIRVLEELRRLAFSDVRGLFDDVGHLRSLTELTDEQAAAIASVEIEVRRPKGAEKDADIETIHKIKVWDKPRTLEMLAKHFSLLGGGVLNLPGVGQPRRVIIELEDGGGQS